MQMKVTVPIDELTDIVAESIRKSFVQLPITAGDIDRITATIDPEGQLEALDVYVISEGLLR